MPSNFFNSLRIYLILWVMIILLISAGAQDTRSTTKTESIIVIGSTTVEPIMTDFAEYFMEQTNGLNVAVSASGSIKGAKALAAGECDVAMMSRPMKEKEVLDCLENGVLPMPHAVAMDGLAIAVHPDNPVEDLTLEQVRQIFAGKINNWSEIGGPDMEIIRIGRDTSSGTFGSFSELVMDEEKITHKIECIGSSGAPSKAISALTEAIGYIGLGFRYGVKVLKINGIAATEKNIREYRYPISRPLYIYTNGYPTVGSKLHAFVSLYLTEPGENMIIGQAYVPITVYSPDLE